MHDLKPFLEWVELKTLSVTVEHVEVATAEPIGDLGQGHRAALTGEKTCLHYDFLGFDR